MKTVRNFFDAVPTKDLDGEKVAQTMTILKMQKQAFLHENKENQVKNKRKTTIVLPPHQPKFQRNTSGKRKKAWK